MHMHTHLHVAVHAVARDQAVDRHRARLAQAVRAVLGLLVDLRWGR